MCSLITLLFASLFIIGRSELQIDLQLEKSRVVVNDDVKLNIVVFNASNRPSFWTTIEIDIGGEVNALTIPPLLANRQHSILVDLPTQKRQVVQLGPVDIVRVDPLRIFRSAKHFSVEKRLFVHPFTVGVPSTEVGQIRDLEGNPSKKITASDIPFHALREYVPGDAPKHIHWKSSAKLDKLMVRQFEETRRSKIAIVLSTNPHDWASQDEFEVAVSCVGSIGIQAIMNNHDIQVFTTDKSISGTKKLESSSAHILLDELTVVNFNSDSKTLVEAVTLARDIIDATFAILVCGSVLDSKEIEKASIRLPLNTHSCALRVEQGAQPRTVNTAGINIVTVAEPADIRMFIVRQVM
ncbi:hypothetical protein FACS1894125_2560 [Actinomycetota bacterium]|nr:hypothetical protein FACS1894125_2560 [Actinomycetota bacterium]